MQQTSNVVRGNSATAERLPEDAAQGAALNDIADLGGAVMSGSPTRMAGAGIGWAARRARGINEPVADRLSSALMDPSPQTRHQVIAELLRSSQARQAAPAHPAALLTGARFLLPGLLGGGLALDLPIEWGDAPASVGDGLLDAGLRHLSRAVLSPGAGLIEFFSHPPSIADQSPAAQRGSFVSGATACRETPAAPTPSRTARPRSRARRSAARRLQQPRQRRSADALTDSLSRSGKGGMQANMNMGGKRIVNLGDAADVQQLRLLTRGQGLVFRPHMLFRRHQHGVRERPAHRPRARAGGDDRRPAA